MGTEPRGISVDHGLSQESAQQLRLQWRPYRFTLPRELVTSQGAWSERQGWLLRLEGDQGRLGWGEAVLPISAVSERRLGPASASAPRGRETDRGQPLSGAPAMAADSRGRQQIQHDSCDRGPLDLGANVTDLARVGDPERQDPACQGAVATRAGHRHNDGTGATHAWLDLDPTCVGLPQKLERRELEALLPQQPPWLACALGMALAELDGLGGSERGGWRTAPPSAVLLPAGEAAITALEEALARRPTDPAARTGGETTAARCSAVGPGHTTHPAGLNWQHPGAEPSGGGDGLTIKWKVATGDDALERRVLEALLQRLPADGRLRLDANGGWDRATAERWAARLADETRLEWLEQPLHPDDHSGLEQLATRVPVALDESLRLQPPLHTDGWRGWQVRRPLVEGDPRPLVAALAAGTPRLMVSTALETGIGRRLLHHLAALQALGPTPTAPGLAPGWRPRGKLFAQDPEAVWAAAG